MKHYTLIFFLFIGPLNAAMPTIEIETTLDAGIMPQLALSAQGHIYLLYFKGKKKGNLFFSQRDYKSKTWSKPLRVNAKIDSVSRGSALGAPRMKIGPGDKTHILWMNSSPVTFMYTSSINAPGGIPAFAPPQNVLKENITGIDTGPALAVQGKKVSVLWHAGSLAHEETRAVIAMHSTNNGVSFGREQKISEFRQAGICSCCGISAAYDPGEKLAILYRSVKQKIDRAMSLVVMQESQQLEGKIIAPWNINGCPTSTSAIAYHADLGFALVWETQGDLYWGTSKNRYAKQYLSGIKQKRRKNPAIAINQAGHTLIAWGDGAGWASGGKLWWQQFGPLGAPISGVKSNQQDIPSYSVPAVIVKKDQSFLIMY